VGARTLGVVLENGAIGIAAEAGLVFVMPSAGSRRRLPSTLAHVPAKHALGLDPKVESGSPTGTCAKSESAAFSIHMGSLGDPIWMENAVGRGHNKFNAYRVMLHCANR
jgi:hypothetical protein